MPPRIRLVAPPAIKDLSVENPDREISGVFALRLPAEIFLNHRKVTLSPLSNHDGLVKELIERGHLEPSALDKNKERMNLMEISLSTEIRQVFQQKTTYLLSLTISSFTTMDLRVSVDENRYEAAALLLPAMRGMIKAQLGMSSLNLDMEQDPIFQKFFSPENLRNELRNSDASLQVQSWLTKVAQ